MTIFDVESVKRTLRMRLVQRGRDMDARTLDGLPIEMYEDLWNRLKLLGEDVWTAAVAIGMVEEDA